MPIFQRLILCIHNSFFSLFCSFHRHFCHLPNFCKVILTTTYRPQSNQHLHSARNEWICTVVVVIIVHLFDCLFVIFDAVRRRSYRFHQSQKKKHQHTHRHKNSLIWESGKKIVEIGNDVLAYKYVLNYLKCIQCSCVYAMRVKTFEYIYVCVWLSGLNCVDLRCFSNWLWKRIKNKIKIDKVVVVSKYMEIFSSDTHTLTHICEWQENDIEIRKKFLSFAEIQQENYALLWWYTLKWCTRCVMLINIETQDMSFGLRRDLQ